MGERDLDIVNEVGDTVLSDDVKSAKWDWSHKLVGKVSKEVQIPISNSDDREFLFRIMRQGCLDYLKYIISKNRAYKWNEAAGAGVKPTLDNIHLTHSWIVSQYAGEYNPYHHHSGDFSAVIYLKIPPKIWLLSEGKPPTIKILLFIMPCFHPKTYLKQFP